MLLIMHILILSKDNDSVSIMRVKMREANVDFMLIEWDGQARYNVRRLNSIVECAAVKLIDNERLA